MEMTVTDPETGATFRTNPCRDVAYFMPQLLPDLEDRLDPKFLPAGDLKRLSDAGVDAAQLKKTFATLSMFFVQALQPNVKSIPQALAACGFFDEPKVCQDILLETFAKSCVGACWAGLRSSVMEGECPPLVSVLRDRATTLLDQFGPTAR